MSEKPKAEKTKTRAALEKELAAVSSELASFREVHRNVRDQLEAAVKREKETRALFDDLKQRLVVAEANNQRMRGYIDRVQEDDVVREELVTVGDPTGEQRLQSKRKPTSFCEPFPYGSGNGQAATGYIDAAQHRISDRAARPKHWITY